MNKTAAALTARLDQSTWADKIVMALNPADGLCSLCRGSGHLMCWQEGVREFWDCPACGGAGCRTMHGKPVYNVKSSGFVRHAS